MDPSRVTYVRLATPVGRLEEALQELVAPLLREIEGNRLLDAAFFARYQWEALIFILGEPEWLSGPLGSLVEARVAELRAKGLVLRQALAGYQPEYERYGGVEGMRLAERIFQEDSLACLELIEADSRGLLGKSRREYSLVLTERLLDLLHFDPAWRISFYRFSYAWALEQGTWQEDDLRLLEKKYQGVKDGLASLLDHDPERDSEALYGGAEPADIAERWIEATRPLIDRLVDGHAEGRIQQDLVQLAWSYTHMQCNRLGITGDAEAILRFFMHRLYEDGMREAV